MNLRLPSISNSNLNRPRGLTGWLLFGIFGLIALGLLFSGIWFYRQQAQVIREDKFSDLKSIADLKIGQIVQWRQERLNDISVNSGDPFFRSAIQQWLKTPQDTVLKSRIQGKLQLIMDQYNYQNIILVTPDGQVLISLDPNLMLLETEYQRLLTQAVASGTPIFGDFFRNPLANRIYLDLAAPILNEDGLPVAVLILRIDPERYLYPLIQSWPTSSQSAETLLIRKEGEDVLYLNTLRHRADPPLTLRIPLSHDEVPAVQAILGHTGQSEGVDYRGVDVLAQIAYVPGTAWYMIAKVDAEEILSEVRSLGLFVTLLVILSILMTAALVAYLSNDRQRRLYQNLFQSERERREAQEEIRTTLYSIGDGVITVDARGRITRLNPVAESLTGWRESESFGRPLQQVFQIFHETTRTEVENPVARVLREGRIVGLTNHTVLVARDGTERPISDSGAPIRDENGKVSGVVLVFRDQTEERAAQKERTTFNDMMGASLNEIYIFDALTLRFRFINESALHNLGYSLQQIQSMTPLDLKPEFTLEKFLSLIQPLFDGQKQVLVFETIHRRADGSLYPVEVHLQLFDHEGDQVFLAVINDISERKQAEQEIKLLNANLERRVIDRTAQLETANQELEAFANSVSHDLRAPLRAMDGFSAALLSDYGNQLDERGQHYLARIQEASRRMGQLIGDLLSLSRVTRVELTRQAVDLSPLAREIATDLQLHNPQQRVEFIIADKLPVEGDPHLLRIVLENLINNAFKFSSQRTPARIEVGVNERDGQPIYFVRDNGVGFDMAYAGKLFIPFQRLHGMQEYPGTGIGLVTVQRIIHRHGGRIWPEAGVDQGATFYFTLGGS
jgi:PAS domain S-box-containing protein